MVGLLFPVACHERIDKICSLYLVPFNMIVKVSHITRSYNNNKLMCGFLVPQQVLLIYELLLLVRGFDSETGGHSSGNH